jgi:hypothetical protein
VTANTWHWERELCSSALGLVPDWYRDMTPNGASSFHVYTSPVTDATVNPHLAPAEYRVARLAWELRAAMAAPKASGRELWARRVRLLAELRRAEPTHGGAMLRDSGRRESKPARKPVPVVEPHPLEARDAPPLATPSYLDWLDLQHKVMRLYLDIGPAIPPTPTATTPLPREVTDSATLTKWARAKVELDRRRAELLRLSAWYHVCPQDWAFNPALPTARDRELVPVGVRGERSLVQDKPRAEPKDWLVYGFQLDAYLAEFEAAGEALGRDAATVRHELATWLTRGRDDFAGVQAIRATEHFVQRECQRLHRWGHTWNRRVATATLPKLRKVPDNSGAICKRRKCYRAAMYYVGRNAYCTEHAREASGAEPKPLPKGRR